MFFSVESFIKLFVVDLNYVFVDIIHKLSYKLSIMSSFNVPSTINWPIQMRGKSIMLYDGNRGLYSRTIFDEIDKEICDFSFIWIQFTHYPLATSLSLHQLLIGQSWTISLCTILLFHYFKISKRIPLFTGLLYCWKKNILLH